MSVMFMFQGSVGELESRSPTPTPPVLEPEVTLPRPAPAPDTTEAGTEAEQGPDQSSEQGEEEEEETAKYIPRLLDAAGNVTPRSRDQNLEPAEWSVQNVTSFLEVRHMLYQDDSNICLFRSTNVPIWFTTSLRRGWMGSSSLP